MPEPTSVISADENWQPRRCSNPWKRDCCNGQSEVYRRMLGILNRVTDSSIPILLDQALELPLNQPEHLEEVLSLLLNKVQDEPLFVKTYATFCAELTNRINAKDSIITLCDEHFSSSFNLLLGYPETTGQNFSISIVREEYVVRKQFIVLIAFICELFKVGIIPLSLVASMGRNILSQEDTRCIECICRYYTFLGQEAEQLCETSLSFVNESFTYLEAKLQDMSLPLRTKFLIQDLLEFRNNDWRPPNSNF